MKRLATFTAGMVAGAALLWYLLGLEDHTDDDDPASIEPDAPIKYWPTSPPDADVVSEDDWSAAAALPRHLVAVR